MSKLVTTLVALGLAIAFVSPTLAAPLTKKECQKSHMKWDAATKTCS
jgi:hypothetical protein